MEESSRSLPQPGEVVVGKYRIEEVVGSGGMGIVVRAVHVHLQERVAMKLLYPEAAMNTDAIARFVREARASARIKSEHVVRVTDVGTLENGAPYLVMEYLDGQDLSRLVESRGPLPLEEAVEYVLQACEGIAEAHAMGIVHRDLKPANLFLVKRSDGRRSVKVLDFGISKVIDSAGDVALTSTSMIMGSPLYMSPEQIRSAKSVDHRSDVWALGVILYELLAGRAPFGGDTVPEVSVKIAIEPPVPLRTLRNDLPPAFEAVILRCLEKDRERRFANVADFAAALVPYAARNAHVYAERARGVLQAAGLATGASFDATVASVPGSLGAPSSAGVGGPDSVQLGTNAAFGRTSPPTPRRRWAVALAVVGAVAGAGIGAIKLFLPGSVEPAVTTPSAVAVTPEPPPPTVPSVTAVPTVAALPAPTAVAVQPSASAAPAAPETPTVAPPRGRPRPATKASVARGTAPAPPPAPAKAEPKPEPPRPSAPERGLFDDRKL